MKIKTYLLLSFVYLIEGCVFTEAVSPTKFEIMFIDLEAPKNFLKTIYFDGNLISITSEGELVAISDSSNQIDMGLTRKINTQKFEDIFIADGDLLGQNKGKEIFKLSKNYRWGPVSKPPGFQIPFFEDNTYLVTATCSGEWGGSIFFMNKLTGEKYGCEATCPLVVEPLGDGYLVTSSLAHLTGSMSIIKIDNPRGLEVVKKRKRGRTVYVGDDEIKDRHGAQTLVDSIGVGATTSFTYQGRVYMILWDHSNTYISELVQGKLLTVDTLVNKPLWSYQPENTRTKETLVSNFSNMDITGFLVITGNRIKLFRYEKGNHR